MKIALYKSTHIGIPGLYNKIVQWWDQGQYSHCEILFADGMSASSSYMDGGVRFKQIVYNPSKWDFFEIPDIYEAPARKWFDLHTGQRYNLVGNIRFIFDFLKKPADKWFCSEAVAASLGISEPWRISPNGLVSILHIMAVT